jgi:O-antigen/teichoic acid export membrane protein
MTANSESQKRFGRDVIIAGAANLVRSLRNLILVPLITGYLSLSHYGEWELLSIAISLLTPWITCSLGSALIRFLPGRESTEVREGFFSIFLFVLLSSSLATLLLGITAIPLNTMPALASLKNNYFAIALVLTSTSLLGIVQSYFRAFRQMLSHSVFNLIQSFGEVIVIAYLLQRGEPLAAALWALGATRGLLMAVGLLLILADIGYGRPRLSYLRNYLAFAIPLIPNSLFYRLYDSADRFFLFAFVGSSAVGTYAATYMAASLFTTLVSPIHTVLLPAMAELWNRERQEEIGDYIAQVMRFSALLTFPALAGAVVVAHPLLELIIRGETGLMTSHYLLLSISFIMFGFGIPFGDLMATAGLSRRLFLLNGFLAGTNLLLNLILIPRLGIVGAIASTLVCHIAYAFSAGFMARTAIDFSIPWNALARTGLAAAAMALTLAWLVGPQPQTLIGPISTGIALYCVFVLAFGALTKRDLHFLSGLLGIQRTP